MASSHSGPSDNSKSPTTQGRSSLLALDGQRFGRYEALIQLAAGGMGRVIVAQHRSSGAVRRLVALKTVHEHLLQDETFLRMFHREANVASRLHHPNVVPVLELDEGERGPFMVMEFFASVPLSAVLRAASRQREPLAWDVVAAMIADACAGAHAAHELRDESGALLNIVHRDLTPSNLLIGVGATVRVADFGVARAQSAAIDEVTVSPDEIRGKLGYLSPEQVMGERLDRRSDVFTLGIVLWEALCGQRLFPRRDSEAATMRAILDGPIPSVADHRADVPATLVRIIERALERDRDRRYRSADELRAALLSCTDGATVDRRSELAARFVDGEVHALEARIEAAAQALAQQRSTSPATIVQTASASTSPPEARARLAAAPWLVVLLVGVGVLALGGAAALLVARREPASESAAEDRAPPSSIPIDARATEPQDSGAPSDASEAPAIDAGQAPPRTRRQRSRRLPLF